MATFTLTTNLLRNISDDKRYICDLLWTFTQSNSHKVAKDDKGKLLDKYKNLISSGNFHHILTWIDLMEKIPSSFVTIEVDYPVSDEDLYLMISKNVNGSKKIIVSSHQEWKKYKYIIEGNIIHYEGENLDIIDRDEALEELIPGKNITNISHSIVATQGSQISDSKLK